METTLKTPDDIRKYVKDTITENIFKYNFENIELLRDITDKIIVAIDLYIDMKLDLALKTTANCIEIDGLLK